MKTPKKKRSRSIRMTDSQSNSEGTSQSEKGRMMSDENEEDSRVGLPVYKQYLKYLSGWRFIVLSQLSMIGFITFKMLNDYQIGNWATSPD